MAHVCQCTGWTWDYVLWNIDLPRLEVLNKQWKQHPPIHLMLASYFGIEVGGKAKEKEQPQDLGELVGAFEMDTTPLPPQDPTVGSSHLRK